MRKVIILTLLLIGVKRPSHAQEVEKSIWQVQTGFLTLMISNESQLYQNFILKSEIGFIAGFRDGIFYEKPLYLVVPSFTLQPRWYYNLNKRHSKGKRTRLNSGNFLAFETALLPLGLTISNYGNTTNINYLTTGFSWGVRRSWSWFNFETSVGYNYYIGFYKLQGASDYIAGFAPNLTLRIGANLTKSKPKFRP